jgi:5'-methylthioadenosine phosphorylase
MAYGRVSSGMSAEIGIIGGSGLQRLVDAQHTERHRLSTPFGAPSDEYVITSLCGRRVAYLRRHGAGHVLLPSEINHRANIYGFKMLGVERLLSLSAVGSLKERYLPLDIVIPDQFYDNTKTPPATFFGGGIAVHIGFADPICGYLASILGEAVAEAGRAVHCGGTYVNIAGPHFSTRAESLLYRSWNMDVIGMTNIHEARLAREAELCYATVAFVTDYDSWHAAAEPVSHELVIARQREGVAAVPAILEGAVRRIERSRECKCATALSGSIATDPEAIAGVRRVELDLLVGKYLQQRCLEWQ